MNLEEAEKIVEDMPEDEFQEWYKHLPYRVRMIVQSGFVDWKKCLATWYLRQIC